MCGGRAVGVFSAGSGQSGLPHLSPAFGKLSFRKTRCVSVPCLVTSTFFQREFRLRRAAVCGCAAVLVTALVALLLADCEHARSIRSCRARIGALGTVLWWQSLLNLACVVLWNALALTSPDMCFGEREEEKTVEPVSREGLCLSWCLFAVCAMHLSVSWRFC